MSGAAPAPAAAVDDAVAAELLGRGRSEFARGRPRDAARLLRNASTAARTAEVRARALISLALAEFELHGLAEATTRLAEAEVLVDRHGLTAVRAALHNQRGIFHLRQGSFTAALAEFDAGVALPGEEFVDDRCRILSNRAVVHIERADVPAARADLTWCIAVARPAGLRLHEAMAVHNLGYVEFLAGNLPVALRLMDEAREMDPDDSPGVSLLGKAYVLVEAGLLSEAESTLRDACAILSEQRLTFDLAEAELERARCTLALGDAVAARRLAASARDRYRRRDNDAGRRAAELVVLQADVARGRTTPRLLDAARGLRDELLADGLRLPARSAGLLLAQALLVRGDAAGAAAAVGTAGVLRADDPITGRLQAHYVRARVDAAQGRRGAAQRRIVRAQTELAAYQATFGSLDMRTASAVHGRRLSELDLALALDGSGPSAVFRAAERTRAVSSRITPVRPPDDPLSAELLAELRQVLESLRGSAVEPGGGDALLRRRRDLERQIIARGWQLAGPGTVSRPAGLTQVRAELAAGGRQMVTYVQSGGRLSAVVVAGRLRRHDLGPSAPVLELIMRTRADLDVLAQPQVTGAIRTAVRASLQRSLDELARLLIIPLGPIDTPLVLVSTGKLGQLPWASLAPLHGVPIVVASSATAWLRACAGRAGSSHPGSGRDDARVGVVALAGPGLVRADDEAATVARSWAGATVIAPASRDDLTSSVATARILHVAAHGVHQPDSPLFSSLRMADGPVFAHELDHAHDAPEHVVLSACEVGLATVRPGDEALGLASVLLQLGTRSVVAGLGRVSDDTAARTMAIYHGRLAAGDDTAAALATALATVDSDVVPPFVCFGAAWAA